MTYSDDDKAWWISTTRPGNPMGFDEAKAFAHKFLPADAKLLRTEKHPQSGIGYTNVVYIYYSAAISQLFPADKFPAWMAIPDPWRGAPPGTFNVVIEQSDSDGTVDVVDVIIGAYYE